MRLLRKYSEFKSNNKNSEFSLEVKCIVIRETQTNCLRETKVKHGYALRVFYKTLLLLMNL